MDKLTILILSLLSFKGIGNQTVLNYLDESKNHRKDFSFTELRTTKIKKIQKLIVNKTITNKSWPKINQNSSKKLSDSLSKKIQIINCLDNEYPQRLKKISNRPVLLYLKGNKKLLNANKIITMVGTRTPSVTSQIWTEKIITDLSDEYVVISGLARGIDTIVHQAVVTNKRSTIAVLAHGLDMPIYPYENKDLALEILKAEGLLISTYPNGTKVYPHNLVARDEWQSALSDGLIVAETGIHSGTTNTINFSIKHQKKIMIFDDKKLEGNQHFLSKGMFSVKNTLEIKRAMSQ
ncbi:DNA-processing protein DprA [Companilactobacillus baiquanensis]|uniref:DNA-processing protein DprA n=1 Tax=Companilactobacillus baiquanensis TaxID=2486005 RepID=A0ABW1UXC2_9LACO|nr:DNA-processing protein DprA [Companilactobacillus baiquanensis]